jgi:hypothetical protein
MEYAFGSKTLSNDCVANIAQCSTPTPQQPSMNIDKPSFQTIHLGQKKNPIRLPVLICTRSLGFSTVTSLHWTPSDVSCETRLMLHLARSLSLKIFTSPLFLHVLVLAITVVSSLLSKESIFFHCQEQGKVLDGEPGK